MQKLSIGTAFIVVCVSLGISKYLSTAKQTFLLTQETPTELITSPSLKQPSKQTSLLTLEAPTELITSPSLKQPSKQTSTANQTSLLTLEAPTELITSPSSKQPPKAISILEQEVFEQVNEYRVSRNLPRLRLDSRISEQARIYSQAMASGEVPFGQEGLELHTEAISNVISYQGIAENVAYNLGYSDPVRAAVGSWLRNPERGLVSIEGQYELTGIGVATNIKGEYYFTQIFIHR